MSAPESPAKICVVCGEDCSQRQRVRDAQGKYTCKECAQKRAATTPGQAPVPAAARAAPVDVGSAMADFDFEPCPGCGAPLAAKAGVCMTCGYNKATGKQIKTKVVAAPKGPIVNISAAQVLGATSTAANALAIGAIVINIAAGIAALVVPEAVIVAILVGFLTGLVTSISAIFTAFREGNKGWGVVNILAIFVPGFNFAMMYYALKVTEADWLRRFAIATVVSFLVFVEAVFLAVTRG